MELGPFYSVFVKIKIHLFGLFLENCFKTASCAWLLFRFFGNLSG